MLRLFITLMVLFVAIPTTAGYNIGTYMMKAGMNGNHQRGLRYSILFGSISIVLMEQYLYTNTESDTLGNEVHC